MHASFRASLLPLLLVAALTWSCGNDDAGDGQSKAGGNANVVAVGSGKATVNGSVEGLSLAPQSAIFGGSPNVARSLFVSINTQAGYCASLQNGTIEPNQKSLLIGLNQSGNATTGLAPGTYPIATSGQTSGDSHAVGLFYAGNGNCKQSLKKSYGIVTGGNVTLTALSDTQVTGTFSLSVGSDRLTGEFDAAPCDRLVSSIAKQGNLRCGAP